MPPEDIIYFFQGYKGFDWWWHDIEDDIKQDLLDDLRAWLGERGIPF